MSSQTKKKRLGSRRGVVANQTETLKADDFHLTDSTSVEHRSVPEENSDSFTKMTNLKSSQSETQQPPSPDLTSHRKKLGSKRKNKGQQRIKQTATETYQELREEVEENTGGDKALDATQMLLEIQSVRQEELSEVGERDTLGTNESSMNSAIMPGYSSEVQSAATINYAEDFLEISIPIDGNQQADKDNEHFGSELTSLSAMEKEHGETDEDYLISKSEVEAFSTTAEITTDKQRLKQNTEFECSGEQAIFSLPTIQSISGENQNEQVSHPLDSQPQDTVGLEEQTNTDFSPTLNRRKLGSSRRNKERQHVKDYVAESYNKYKEEVAENIGGNELCETPKMSLVIDTEEHVKSVETMLKGKEEFDTHETDMLSDQVMESAHCIGISELNDSTLHLALSVDQQLNNPSHTMKMRDEVLPSVNSVTNIENQERDEEIDLVMQWGIKQTSNLENKSHLKSEDIDLSVTTEVTTETNSHKEHSELKCSNEQPRVSSPKEDLCSNEEQIEHLNLCEARQTQHSDETVNKQHEEEVKSTEMKQISLLDDSSENVIHDATENSESGVANLKDKAEVSDTYQSEMSVINIDDSVTMQDDSNPDDKQVIHHLKRNTEVVDLINENNHAYDENPQTGDTERADTALVNLYEGEGQLEDNIKSTAEQTSFLGKEVLLSESKSSFETLNSETDFLPDSQPEDNSVKPDEENITDFSHTGNRRKLGSSRRNKGQQHVKGSVTEPKHKPDEEVVEDIGANEAVETTKLALALQTTNQEESDQDSEHNVMSVTTVLSPTEEFSTNDKQNDQFSLSDSRGAEHSPNVGNEEYEEEHNSTEMQQIRLLDDSPESLICDTTEYSEFGVANLSGQAEVSDTYQSEMSVKSIDDSAATQDDLNPDKENQHPVKESDVEVLDQINEGRPTYDTKNPQTNDTEGHLEDNIKSTVEQTSLLEEEVLLSEMEENRSSLEALTSETDFLPDSQPEDDSVKPCEENITDFSHTGNRRKLGSSRRSKGRQHVKGSVTESKLKPDEEVVEDIRANEAVETTEVALTLQTINQEESDQDSEHNVNMPVTTVSSSKQEVSSNEEQNDNVSLSDLRGAGHSHNVGNKEHEEEEDESREMQQTHLLDHSCQSAIHDAAENSGICFANLSGQAEVSDTYQSELSVKNIDDSAIKQEDSNPEAPMKESNVEATVQMHDDEEEERSTETQEIPRLDDSSKNVIHSPTENSGICEANLKDQAANPQISDIERADTVLVDLYEGEGQLEDNIKSTVEQTSLLEEEVLLSEMEENRSSLEALISETDFLPDSQPEDDSVKPCEENITDFSHTGNRRKLGSSRRSKGRQHVKGSVTESKLKPDEEVVEDIRANEAVETTEVALTLQTINQEESDQDSEHNVNMPVTTVSSSKQEVSSNEEQNDNVSLSDLRGAGHSHNVGNKEHEEEEDESREMQQTHLLDHSCQSAIHDAAENSGICFANLSGQAEVSDTYQSELSVKNIDDSAIKQEDSNPEAPMKESNVEATVQMHDDEEEERSTETQEIPRLDDSSKNVIHSPTENSGICEANLKDQAANPQISDIERADTVLVDLYEGEGQLEDNIKSTVEQTSLLEEEVLLSEMEENRSSLEALISETDFLPDSQPEDDSVKPCEENITDFSHTGNRRKLGSSRRSKGRQHVKGSVTESKLKPDEEVVEDIRANEAVETTEVALTLQTINQEESDQDSEHNVNMPVTTVSSSKQEVSSNEEQNDNVSLSDLRGAGHSHNVGNKEHEEEEDESREMQQTHLLDHSCQSAIHDAAENSGICFANLSGQAEVSDTYQSELSVKNIDDSAIKQEDSNPEAPMKESNVEATVQMHDDEEEERSTETQEIPRLDDSSKNVIHSPTENSGICEANLKDQAANPQISDIERADTVLVDLYEGEGQLEDNIKSTVKQTSLLEEEVLLSEMEENRSSLEALTSETDFLPDSQPEDDSVKPDEENITDFSHTGNRRKLGSSRRSKGRQHVKGSVTESKLKPDEEVVEDIRANEAVETTEVALTLQTINQEESDQDSEHNVNMPVTTVSSSKQEVSSNEEQNDNVSLSDLRGAGHSHNVGNKEHEEEEDESREMQQTHLLDHSCQSAIHDAAENSGICFANLSGQAEVSDTYQSELSVKNIDDSAIKQEDSNPEAPMKESNVEATVQMHDDEEEERSTETQEIPRLDDSSKNVIHSPTENSGICEANLKDQAVVCDTYQSELSVKNIDDSATNQKDKNLHNKPDEHYLKENYVDVGDQINEDHSAYHVNNPQISDTGRADTVLVDLYEGEGQLEDNIKSTAEQTSLLEEEVLLSEMEENRSSLTILTSETDFLPDSQPEDDSVKPDEENVTDFSHTGNRRKLGSSRRSKGRQHVKGSVAESKHKPDEEVVEDIRANEAVETTEVALTLQTINQEESDQDSEHNIIMSVTTVSSSKQEVSSNEEQNDNVSLSDLRGAGHSHNVGNKEHEEEEDESREMQQTHLLDHSCQSAIHDAAENSGICFANLSGQAEVSDTYQSELSVKNIDDSAIKQEDSNPEAPMKESNVEATVQMHDDEEEERSTETQEIPRLDDSSKNVIHSPTENSGICEANLKDQAANPQISDIERADTVLVDLYEGEGQLEDNIKSTVEQTSLLEEEVLLSEMEENRSSLEALTSETDFLPDSQPEDDSVKPDEENITDFSHTGNRRKLGSSRRSKGRQHVKGSVTESKLKPDEEVVEDIRANEAVETTEVALTLQTINQEESDQDSEHNVNMPVTTVSSSKQEVSSNEEQNDNVSLSDLRGAGHSHNVGNKEHEEEEDESREMQQTHLLDHSCQSAIHDAAENSGICFANLSGQAEVSDTYQSELSVKNIDDSAIKQEDSNPEAPMKESNVEATVQMHDDEEEERSTETQEIPRLDDSSKNVIHSPTENSGICEANLKDQAVVCDTYQSELSVKNIDDSATNQKDKNLHNKPDEHYLKENYVDVGDQINEDHSAYHANNPQISDTGRADTVLVDLYEGEGQLEDNIKSTAEQTSLLEEEVLLSEMEENRSSLEALTSEIDFLPDSQLEDDSVKPCEENVTDFSHTGNRRKLGSSRRSKGRQHVKGSVAESKHKPDEEAVEDIRAKEAVETAKLALVLQTTNQEESDQDSEHNVMSVTTVLSPTEEFSTNDKQNEQFSLSDSREAEHSPNVGNEEYEEEHNSTEMQQIRLLDDSPESLICDTTEYSEFGVANLSGQAEVSDTYQSEMSVKSIDDSAATQDDLNPNEENQHPVKESDVEVLDQINEGRPAYDTKNPQTNDTEGHLEDNIKSTVEQTSLLEEEVLLSEMEENRSSLEALTSETDFLPDSQPEDDSVKPCEENVTDFSHTGNRRKLGSSRRSKGRQHVKGSVTESKLKPNEEVVEDIRANEAVETTEVALTLQTTNQEESDQDSEHNVMSVTTVSSPKEEFSTNDKQNEQFSLFDFREAEHSRNVGNKEYEEKYISVTTVSSPEKEFTTLFSTNEQNDNVSSSELSEVGHSGDSVNQVYKNEEVKQTEMQELHLLVDSSQGVIHDVTGNPGTCFGDVKDQGDVGDTYQSELHLKKIDDSATMQEDSNSKNPMQERNVEVTDQIHDDKEEERSTQTEEIHCLDEFPESLICDTTKYSETGVANLKDQGEVNDTCQSEMSVKNIDYSGTMQDNPNPDETKNQQHTKESDVEVVDQINEGCPTYDTKEPQTSDIEGQFGNNPLEKNSKSTAAETSHLKKEGLPPEMEDSKSSLEILQSETCVLPDSRPEDNSLKEDEQNLTDLSHTGNRRKLGSCRRNRGGQQVKGSVSESYHKVSDEDVEDISSNEALEITSLVLQTTNQGELSQKSEHDIIMSVNYDNSVFSRSIPDYSPEVQNPTSENNPEAELESNDTTKPQTSDTERVDTALVQVYDSKGQLEEITKPTVEQISHTEKEGVLSEMDRSKTTLETLQPETDAPFHLQPEDNSVKPDEQTVTDVSPIGNRRKLGSSRRHKGRQHVKSSGADSYHKPTEDVDGNTRDNKPNETTNNSLAIETVVQEIFMETELEEKNEFDSFQTEVSDEVKVNPHVSTCELTGINIHCVTDTYNKGDKDTDLLRERGLLQTGSFVNESHLKSGDIEFSVTPVTTEKSLHDEHAEPNSSIEQSTISSPEEELSTNAEQNEHFNLSEVRGPDHSEEAVNKVLEEEDIKLTETQKMHQQPEETRTGFISTGNRRKMGSSRRKKGMQQVLGSVTKPYSDLKEEIVNDSWSDEASNTEKVSLATETIREESEEQVDSSFKPVVKIRKKRSNEEENTDNLPDEDRTLSPNVMDHSAIVTADINSVLDKDELTTCTEDEKKHIKEPDILTPRTGPDATKADVIQSAEVSIMKVESDMQSISYHHDSVSTKSVSPDVLEQKETFQIQNTETLSCDEDVVGQKIHDQQIDYVKEAEHSMDIEVHGLVEVREASEDPANKAHEDQKSNSENLQGKLKQKRRKIGSSRRVQLRATQEKETEYNETNETNLTMKADVEELPLKVTTEVSHKEIVQSTMYTAYKEQQEMSEPCSVHDEAQKLHSSAPDIQSKETNMMPGTESLAVRPEQATMSYNEVVNSVTQNDEQISEGMKEIQDQAFKSTQAPSMAVADSEKVQFVVKGAAEEDGKNDPASTQEPESVTDMKDASPNFSSTSRRRKLGSTRKNLGSRSSKGDDLHHKQEVDNEETATNVVESTEELHKDCSNSDSEQRTKKVFETVEYSHTGESQLEPPAHQTAEENPDSFTQLVEMEQHPTPDNFHAKPSTSPEHDAISESAVGERRKKLGSNRKSRGHHSALNKISEVERSDKPPSSEISISKATEHLKPVSEAPERVTQVKQPHDEVNLGQTFSLGVSRGADIRSSSYNVLMVGDSCVGKTSFMKRAQSGKFSIDLPSSVGLDTCKWTVVVDGKPVVLQIWDTAGQERFHSITRQVFHKAHAFLLMYDVTSSESFSAVSYWANCIEQGAAENVTILLLGNKCDRADRQVTTQKGENLAKECDFGFMECSAATGENVLYSLETVARMLSESVDIREEAMVLHKEPPKKKKSGCC